MNTIELYQTTNSAAILTALKYEVLDIDAVKVPKHYPKRMTEKALQAAMRAISRTGQQLMPVLIDDDDNLIFGLEIVEPMRELGGTKIAVVRVSDLTSAEYKALQVFFAKLPELSQWNESALQLLLEEIEINDPDLLDLTGLEMGEIDMVLRDADEGEPSEGVGDFADDPEADDMLTLGIADDPTCQSGDCFALGDHRILCGNALEHKVCETVMAGESATAVITDPPFNIPIAGHVSGLGKNKHADFAMGVGEMSFDKFEDFLADVLSLVMTYLIMGGLIYTFMDRRHLEELFLAGRRLGLTLLDLCIWNKGKGGMGGIYRSQHEPCVVFKRGDNPHINNVKLGVYDRNRTNIWTHPGMGSFGKGRDEALAAHPTVKPWPMLAEIIKDCTGRGDIVLDPFLGSGSTLLPAERTGRRCYGIELEAKYVEVAIARWEKMTGGKAIHEGTGLTLAELRQTRTTNTQSKALTDETVGG